MELPASAILPSRSQPTAVTTFSGGSSFHACTRPSWMFQRRRRQSKQPEMKRWVEVGWKATEVQMSGWGKMARGVGRLGLHSRTVQSVEADNKKLF